MQHDFSSMVKQQADIDQWSPELTLASVNVGCVCFDGPATCSMEQRPTSRVKPVPSTTSAFFDSRRLPEAFNREECPI